MRQKNTVAMPNRTEYAQAKSIRLEATKTVRGRVEKTPKGSRTVRFAQSENMMGFTGTGRNVKPIPNPSRTKAVQFGGKTYHVPKNIAG